MDKQTYKRCIEYEVYKDYKESKNRLNLLDKIWCRYLSPSSNAIYLIRKKLYLSDKGKIGKLLSTYYRILLMRRYSIHVNDEAIIDIGFRIVHPMCIDIAKCNIGSNFTMYQNCTIGVKSLQCLKTPKIGNNVTMYAGSQIIGGVKVGDNVSVGASALVVKDALEPGVYVGIPAKKRG